MATGFSRNINLRQEKVLSENNVPKGVKDVKSSGIIAPRRPVLNEISSNLQVNQNGNQKGKITINQPNISISKPSTRLTTKNNCSNRTTTSITTKVKHLSNTSKTALKVNENISNIPRAIPRPNKGILAKNSSLQSKSAGLTEILKKEQEWIIASKVDPVDKSDEYDPFLVGEYAKHIFEYLLTLENKYIIKQDYLADQKYITPSNRSVVVDWLIEVQQEFQIMQESLFTAVGILDRYLQNNNEVSRKELQLIGATCLLLGCKYEEIYVPEISDFVYLSDNAFTKDEVKSCLVDVFRTIGFSLSRPFSLTFLRRFSRVFRARSCQHSLAKYFLELALVDYNLAHVKPSEIAASGLLLATVITCDPALDNKPEDVNSLLSLYWTDQMQKYTSFKMNDVTPTVTALANLALNASQWKYKAVYKKYQTAKMARIAASSLLSSPAMQFLANPC